MSNCLGDTPSVALEELGGIILIDFIDMKDRAMRKP
jgi:Ribonuclease G/E